MLDTTNNSQSPAMTALDAARDARRTARAAVASAAEDAAKGKAALAQAQAALAAHGDVARELARHRADAIRAGAPADGSLPPSLLIRREDRWQAEQLAAELREAHGQLVADHADAQRACAQAEAAVHAAARAELAAEIAAIADRVEELDRQALPMRLELTAVLHSFVAASAQHPTRPDTLPPGLIAKLQGLHAESPGGLQDMPSLALDAHRLRFRDRLRELIGA